MDNNIKIKEYNKSKKLEELYDRMGQNSLLNENFYAFDKPIKYKNLKFYPITMEFFIPFQILSNCLILKKNLCGDMQDISKTYLDYLCSLFKKGRTDYLLWLEELLLLCLQKDTLYNNGGRESLTIEFKLIANEKWELLIENIPYDSEDFDKIKEIICEQNNIEVPDESIHPEILEKIEEYEKYLIKKNKNKICSLEGQTNILVCVTGLTKDKIAEMSIRTFTNVIKRFGILLNYSLGAILSPNMEKKDKDNILNWICESEQKTKTEEILSDFNQFESKFKNI